MKSSKYYEEKSTEQRYFNNKKPSQKSRAEMIQSKNNKQLLCKISFEIDGQEEELFIYQNATLDQITNQLLKKIIGNDDEDEDSFQEKVSEQQRKALKDQIKSKIQITMESCIDKNAKTEKWKKKLRSIIDEKQKTPIESLSQYGTKRGLQPNISPSIKYFNYKFFNNQGQKQSSYFDLNGGQKSIEIINRAKIVQSLLSEKLQKKEGVQYGNRLYQLSKRNETSKSELYRMREQSEEKQMFSECTFHPNIQRLHFNNVKLNPGSQKRQEKSVFKRLYKEALEKQEMSKIIEKQVSERQEQQLKKFNFIPKINQCSNQIATLKKKLHQKHGISIYQSLYQQGNKKIKEPQVNKNLTFHPKICEASQKMIQKSRSSKTVLRNLFSSKDNSILKTESCAEDQKQKNNSYQQFTIYKQKQNKNKNTSRLVTQKQNIAEGSSLQKNKKLNNFNNSKVINNKDHLETNCSILSFSTNSKTTREKEQNFSNFTNQSYSHQKSNFQPMHKIQPIFTEQKRDNMQHNSHFKSLLKSGERLLRQLDINKTTNEQKDQRRRQRLNPFQFFKLEDTKKQKYNKKAEPESNQKKKPVANEISQQVKNQIYSNVFKLLNSEGNEQLQYENIYKCDGIPTHIKRILYPMAEEMQQLNVGLDQQEFIWSLARIAENLSQKDQREFMEWGKQIDFRT